MAEKIICIVGLSIFYIMVLPFFLVVVKRIGSICIERIIQFCKIWLAAWGCVFKAIQTDGKEGTDK